MNLKNREHEPNRVERAFLAYMRHELRTPINAVIGYSEMLLEDACDSPKDDSISYLQKIHASGQRLLTLVNDSFDPEKIDDKTAADIEAFAANVRYEIREPINSIIGYCELLIEDSEGRRGECFISDLQKIHASGKKLLALIEDIVKLSKIEAGKADIDMETSGVSTMILDAVTTIRLLEKAAETPQAKQGCLLIVDDNEINRDLLSRRLAREGFTVAVAENGCQALKMLQAQKFDMVLLDIMMPEMNGYEVLKHMKADNTLRHIPVIMLSSLDEVDSAVRCIEMGAEDYLPKPFNPVLLRARIGASLEKKLLRDREQAYLKVLRVEKEKSESLLLNVLPKPIADLLKEDRGIIAHSFSEASVLFADLVGFTEFSGHISATELVYVLNEIFSSFDYLSDRYGLEKIKTIGDAYMVVGGVPTPRTDHAEAIAEMAINMQGVIAQFNAENNASFRMRLGVDTGPVVAGVIGTRKFIYDLWGDTVNTASRMESHGVDNHIQVTRAVYNRLRDKYVFEKRGVIQVKGKGEMETFFLTGKMP